MATETEYVDAGTAVDFRNLSPGYVGSAPPFEASPLVVDGIMYVTGWDGWLWALDAKTGAELWRYHRASPYDVSLCCGNVNRGCAVAAERSSWRPSTPT